MSELVYSKGEMRQSDLQTMRMEYNEEIEDDTIIANDQL